MSLIILNVDEVKRTLSASGGAFVVHDKEVDIVRFAINSGFADIVLDGQVALRVMYQRPGETEVRAQTLTYYDTDGLHNYYDWQLSQSDLAKNGSLMVALCILDISGGEVSEWHTTPCVVRVLSTIHTDDSDEGDAEVTPTVKERVAVLETMIQRVASGAPIVVSSMSAMTDTDQIYVLSTDGNWYYHNGSTWVAGGVYGGVPTDTTLTQSGMAADAKATGDAINEVKADLGVLNFFNGMLSGFIPTSGTTYPITNASYPNATYVIVDLLAGQSLKIASFTSANTQGRARCIVNGEIVSTISGNTANYTTTVNLSASINNGIITALKDIQIALIFLNGIVPNGVTATIDGFASVSEMVFDAYNKTFSLTGTISALSDEVGDVESDLEELVEKTFDARDIQYLVPNIQSINYTQGYSVSAGSTSVQLDANANYDSYWYITKEPLTLYAVPTSGQYYALAVLTDAIGTWEEHASYKIIRGTAGARYRLSDNNLPTQENPLTVPAGTMLVYTFPATKYYSVVYEDQLSNILNNAVRLNEGQLAQIPGQKNVYFKYSATSGGDSSNEHLDVYTPYKEGFIHYLVVHTESQAINSDVWRISLAYITDSSFNDITQITTSGEWECAIHLPDRDDFSGGYAHGDEVLISEPAFFKDGIPVDITEFTDYTQCEEFSFVERTTMYDPADSTRGIAQHGSAHIFGKEKLKIQQSVLWLVDTALTNTYLAMLPIAKAVSHSFYTNARHIVTAIGNTNHTESKATEAVIYGDDICCKFSVPVYSPISAYFYETDNGGAAYNKCYFAVAATSVTHGDVWMTESDYEFT